MNEVFPFSAEEGRILHIREDHGGLVIFRIPTDKPEDAEIAQKEIEDFLNANRLSIPFMVIPFSTEILIVEEKKIRGSFLGRIKDKIDNFFRGER